MSAKQVRELLAKYNTGTLSAQHVVDNLQRMFPQENRVSFVRARYSCDPGMTRVFNNRTGDQVANLVHAGPNESPITSARAIWFIMKGDDPAVVGREPGGRLYAQYVKGGERAYV